jgi:hypothetical protein
MCDTTKCVFVYKLKKLFSGVQFKMNLPEEIIEIIFSYLNNDDKLKVLLAAESTNTKNNQKICWFKPMKSLTRDFYLTVDDTNYRDILQRESSYNNIWLRQIILGGFNCHHLRPTDFLPRFRDSLERVTLHYLQLSAFNLSLALRQLNKLREIHIDKCELLCESPTRKFRIKKPNLESVSIVDCKFDVMSLFIGQKMEHLLVFPQNWPFDQRCIGVIDELLEHTISVHFDGEFRDYTSKYNTIKRAKITNNGRSLWLGTQFLQSNCGNLRELEISTLPCGPNGGIEMNFILTKMHLDKFTCDRKVLIFSRRLQPLEEIRAGDSELWALYEVMKHFYDVRKIKFRCSPDTIPDFVSLNTDLFHRVTTLVIKSNYSYPNNLSTFIQHFPNLELLLIRLMRPKIIYWNATGTYGTSSVCLNG